MSSQAQADVSITSVSTDSMQAAAPSSEAGIEQPSASISSKVVVWRSRNLCDLVYAGIGGQFHGDEGLARAGTNASPSHNFDQAQDDGRALFSQSDEPASSQGGQAFLLTVGQEPDWAAKLRRHSPSESTLPRGSAADSEGTHSHCSRSPSSSFSEAEAGSVLTDDTDQSN